MLGNDLVKIETGNPARTAFLVVGNDQLMTFVGSRARRLDFDVGDSGSRILAAENSRQPFGRNGIGRTGHIIEPPGLGARETLERDAPSDFQRCKGGTRRCTHYPTSAFGSHLATAAIRIRSIRLTR